MDCKDVNNLSGGLDCRGKKISEKFLTATTESIIQKTDNSPEKE
ncbi:hypothetical protein [Chryseobacterium viscerum]|nr:hypothetical protein [Chryseobacterium viscerum]